MNVSNIFKNEIDRNVIPDSVQRKTDEMDTIHIMQIVKNCRGCSCRWMEVVYLRNGFDTSSICILRPDNEKNRKIARMNAKITGKFVLSVP